jgi:LexA DNA binding domain
LTAAQNRVYKAIKLLIQKTGQSPSYEEISRVCGLRSLAIIHHHVAQLERGGYIIRQGKIRGIVLAPDKVFHGWHRCERRHKLIFFQDPDCPLCKAMDLILPPRSVEVAHG